MASRFLTELEALLAVVTTARSSVELEASTALAGTFSSWKAIAVWLLDAWVTAQAVVGNEFVPGRL